MSDSIASLQHERELLKFQVRQLALRVEQLEGQPNIWDTIMDRVYDWSCDVGAPLKPSQTRQMHADLETNFSAAFTQALRG